MLDKRCYKNLIENALVREGLIDEPYLSKDYIIDIVNDVCEEIIKKKNNNLDKKESGDGGGMVQ